MSKSKELEEKVREEDIRIKEREQANKASRVIESFNNKVKISAYIPSYYLIFLGALVFIALFLLMSPDS